MNVFLKAHVDDFHVKKRERKYDCFHKGYPCVGVLISNYKALIYIVIDLYYIITILQ